MKSKRIILLLCIILLGFISLAKESTTFLKDGKKVINTIVDMSSRTGHVQYLKDQVKIHRSKIWMINYENQKWNLTRERARLVDNNKDTIFLGNQTKMVGHIVDFSSKRQVWQFKNGREVHVKRILRIYFCCEKLPAAYRKAVVNRKIIRNRIKED